MHNAKVEKITETKTSTFHFSGVDKAGVKKSIGNLNSSKVETFKNTPFFYKQSIFDPRPENCLNFFKKSPKKLFSSCLVDDSLSCIV